MALYAVIAIVGVLLGVLVSVTKIGRSAGTTIVVAALCGGVAAIIIGLLMGGPP
ncbi:hypothetical protein GCM10007913_15200 [Devosia yakushimensis]|uniref:Uncharacterized protein n=1 Tax=Devosia yakushimensis TaxID=470028 RepID=A0ABQ5UEG9_9HYPH|nr:hypothetical protein [Devosia yakushimensis]GLQ09588.1 hypothetical protein GCM10007913_15200 [Devosia yakushimensis]